MIVANVGRDAMGAGCIGRDERGRAMRQRRAKACGPDTAVLVSSFRGKRFSRGRRWQKSRSPGRARYKP
jgi:hypothetical protein